MEELFRILKEQKNKYPLMEKEDFLKLIYQNEMGGGHMIKDKESCLEFLKEESENIRPLFKEADSIGNELSREYLCDFLKRGLPLSYLSSMFIFTANTHRGTLDRLKEKIGLFYEHREEFLPGEDLDGFLAFYREKGFPPVHHSEKFRENYKPAYRVIYKKFITLFSVLEKAYFESLRKERTVIAIDGRCGSGKSTDALLLSKVLECPVIHMDDFFLPKELRTAERLSEPGGNIHYEYFQKAVAEPLCRDDKISYRPFNCGDFSFLDEVKVEKTKFLIVEGSYAHHPGFSPYADVKVFSDIAGDKQIERIRKRNGDACAEIFKEKWIPMEEKYFDTFKIKENSHIIIK